jgi:hypothetical protein
VAVAAVTLTEAILAVQAVVETSKEVEELVLQVKEITAAAEVVVLRSMEVAEVVLEL